ncbi:MAG: BA14K family protein [Rhizobiales bacterium]|nr:BA14K family protein [Hyphomicrobiales bacterium]
MKKLMFMGLCGMALAWAAIPAEADVRSYCEAYARNQADTRLTGSAILGAKVKLAPEEWEERKSLALTDCLALYTSEAGVETVAAEPEKVRAAKPKKARAAKPKLEFLAGTSPAQQEKSAKVAGLVPGSAAWKDYCAAKYASFNRETDTYKSFNGKMRPCRVTKG